MLERQGERERGREREREGERGIGGEGEREEERGRDAREMLEREHTVGYIYLADTSNANYRLGSSSWSNETLLFPIHST